jgi:hypothetical protein
MPLALLAAMPPIFAASIDAGSGPILRPSGASARFACAPITAGPRRIVAPPSRTSSRRKPSPSTTSTESEIACPDRLVPAARRVSGAPTAPQTSSTARMSSSLSATTTTRGTRR